LNKKEQLQFERLTRLLEAERRHSESAFVKYREALYELVDLKMKLERIQKVMNGEE
jgi:site-specific recombinase XerC